MSVGTTSNVNEIQNESVIEQFEIMVSDSYGGVVTASIYAQLVDDVEEKNTWIEW